MARPSDFPERAAGTDLRERAERLGGTLTLATQPREGTNVVTLPL
jgi:signal transduction histidine kinase